MLYEVITPFLWVDKIVFFEGETIVTEKTIPTDLDIFKGHYPDSPIMPGVLLCEAIFQSGALLIGKIQKNKRPTSNVIPVFRITSYNVCYTKLLRPNISFHKDSSSIQR